MRRRIAAACALALGTLSACGDEPAAPRNTPDDALRGFYAAVLRDQDFGAACSFTAPDFYLRDPGAADATEQGEGDEAPLGVESPSAEPRRGPCAELARYVYEKRGASQPYEAWRVEDVALGADERSAVAATTDGDVMLEVTGGEWRLAWALK